MNRTSRHRPLPIDQLPDSHRQLSGRYQVETEGGVLFELSVHVGTRARTGTELMRASIHNLQRGRPGGMVDMRVEHQEIMVLFPGQHRKDIRITQQGSYTSGQLASRSFRDVVQQLANLYTPKSDASGPKFG